MYVYPSYVLKNYDRNILRTLTNELTSDDAVVTMALIPLSWPGSSLSAGNKIMARVAREISEKFTKPLLIQEEMKYADPQIKFVHISEDPTRKGESSVEWNSREVARLQILVLGIHLRTPPIFEAACSCREAAFMLWC